MHFLPLWVRKFKKSEIDLLKETWHLKTSKSVNAFPKVALQNRKICSLSPCCIMASFTIPIKMLHCMCPLATWRVPSYVLWYKESITAPILILLVLCVEGQNRVYSLFTLQCISSFPDSTYITFSTNFPHNKPVTLWSDNDWPKISHEFPWLRMGFWSGHFQKLMLGF